MAKDYMARRLVLLKFVLQAIPMYQLSMIVAPQIKSHSISTLFKKFLWKGAQNSKKWALVAWTNICIPKLEERLGLHDLKLLNNALGVNCGGDGSKG